MAHFVFADDYTTGSNATHTELLISSDRSRAGEVEVLLALRAARRNNVTLTHRLLRAEVVELRDMLSQWLDSPVSAVPADEVPEPKEF